MDSASIMVWSVLFGGIGIGYFLSMLLIVGVVLIPLYPLFLLKFSYKSSCCFNLSNPLKSV